MSTLGLFFRAECVKWRKSWVMLTMILAPVCQVGFLFMILWFSDDLVRRFKPGFQFWVELNYLTWNIVFLPIGIAIISDLSWDLELEAKTWNHLLLQPAPRRTHFLAKLLSHLTLILISQCLLALLLIPMGLLLQSHLGSIMGTWTQPDWFTNTIALHLFIKFAGYSILASLPLVAFHTWLSARFTGLWVALGVALIGIWFCSQYAGQNRLIQFLPWGMASQMVVIFDRWKRHIPWELFPGSLFSGALLTLLGALDFSQDKEKRS
ncbi:MAG TPA: ABC transporter permease [Geothrix sp.]|nr:ABC transporter permease [Geothrix sp.]